MPEVREGGVIMTKLIKGIILGLMSSLVMVTPALAVQVDHKIDICHRTASEQNPWVSVQVDKDAWDEHSSAHSDHVNDFLIDEENPCPPQEEVTCPEGQVLKDEECVTEEQPPTDEETPPTDEQTPPQEETPPQTIKTPTELPQTGENLLWLLIGPSGAVIGTGIKFLARKG